MARERLFVELTDPAGEKSSLFDEAEVRNRVAEGWTISPEEQEKMQQSRKEARARRLALEEAANAKVAPEAPVASEAEDGVEEEAE